MTESGPRVLVVDDDLSIRRFLEIAMRARGYTVAEAADGQAALSAELSFRPDLVILDLGLPDMDGIQVPRRIRDHARVSVLVLSPQNQQDEQVAARDAGR